MTAAPAALLRRPPRIRRFARGVYWPLTIAIGLGVMVWADQHGARQEARLALVLGFLALLLASEPWLALRRDHSVRGDRQRGHDLGHFAAGILVEGLAIAAIVTPAIVAAPRLAAWAGGDPWPGSWPYGLQIGLALLVAEGLDYWRHRMLHAVPWLWQIHALHHDIERLNVVKGLRNHCVSVGFRAIAIYVPLILAGAPVEMLFWYQGAIITTGFVNHANVDLAIPEVLHRIVTTPRVQTRSMPTRCAPARTSSGPSTDRTCCPRGSPTWTFGSASRSGARCGTPRKARSSAIRTTRTATACPRSSPSARSGATAGRSIQSRSSSSRTSSRVSFSLETCSSPGEGVVVQTPSTRPSWPRCCRRAVA